MEVIRIGQSLLGNGHPALIVGELSGNHRGSFEVAKESVLAMKKAGLDAVKIQTLKPENITLNVETPDFVVGGGTIWDKQKFYDLYKDIYTPWEWTKPIMELCSDLGMEFFSSPFGHEEVDFLDECGVSAFKIASFEITDIPLIEHAASKGKPMIISTGIAGREDIALAVDACKRSGNNEIIILKCTSSYPAPPEEADLSLIPVIAKEFNVLVGLSDHTLGSMAPVVAATLGACLIEKHFILDRNLGGPDASFSLEPAEWEQLVKDVRMAELMQGQANYRLTPKMQNSRHFARSLYVAETVKAGDKITEQNVKSVRPGFGLHPKYWKYIQGGVFAADALPGTRFGWELLVGGKPKNVI